MRQTMDVALRQQLTITPQLLQSIRLLALSSVELDHALRDALESNVMLEAQPESGDAAASERELTADWRAAAPGAESPSDDFPAPDPGPRTRIVEQLPWTFTDAYDLEIAFAIVDEVDEAGYLAVALGEVAAMVGAPTARADTILKCIQRLEPVGFGARNLRECLTIQLECLPADEPGGELALRLVNDHLDRLTDGDAAALAEAVGAPRLEVAVAVDLIRSLNPKPGAEPALPDHVIPDVVVEPNGDGSWRVALNEAALPKLRVNAAYEAVLQRDSGAHAELRGQLQEARWLLRGVEMRQDTLLRAAQTIFARQGGFLARGEVGLGPLTLREVATAVEMHESSISRVVRGKYAQTPHGVYELRFFFSAQVGGAHRSDVSGNAVRAMIRQLVDDESAEAPLCDGDLAAALARRGIQVARRTVTKYRHAMGIRAADDRRVADRRVAG